MGKTVRAVENAPRLTDADCKALRLKLLMTQSDFWSRVTATQSAGSRYENGRIIPPSVEVLIRIVYLTNINGSVLDIVNKIVGAKNHSGLPDFIEATSNPRVTVEFINKLRKKLKMK